MCIVGVDSHIDPLIILYDTIDMSIKLSVLSVGFMISLELSSLSVSVSSVWFCMVELPLSVSSTDSLPPQAHKENTIAINNNIKKGGAIKHRLNLLLRT